MYVFRNGQQVAAYASQNDAALDLRLLPIQIRHAITYQMTVRGLRFSTEAALPAPR